MNLAIKVTAAVLMSFFLAACDGDDDDDDDTPPPDPQTVFDVAEADGNFTTLITALETAGLDETLDDPDTNFTVFAPTDAAFALLGDQAITDLLADTDELTNVLLYHVISGQVIDSGGAIAAAGTTVEMANEDSVGISFVDDVLRVNLSIVSTADIEADNGVIHVIDAVLMPPEDQDAPTNNIVETALADDNFETLVAALQAADLVEALSDDTAQFTVFAPTDAAFDALGSANVEALLADVDNLTSILQQHVIAGSAVDAVTAYSLNGMSAETLGEAQIPVTIVGDELRVGGAEVEVTNILTTNGIIHVIDTVIVADAGLPAPEANIAEVATAAGSFETLLTALGATGLDTVLTGDGPFTVFAPTDDAFAELGEQVIAELLADTDRLSDILNYHVVAGASVLADAATTIAVSGENLVEMNNGDNVALTLDDDDSLVINLSNVTSANVMASNGVIHVIDKVLLPPAEAGTPTQTIAEIAAADDRFETLLSALQAAGLDAALADDSATFTVFAPTDDAFGMIDDGQLAALIGDTDALRDVLELHVIAGAAVDSVTAFSLNGEEAITLGEESVEIDVVEGQLQIGGAVVSTFDIYASNGVIHVIDSVIIGDVELPEPVLSIADIVRESDDFDTLEVALEATDLTTVLDNFNATFTVFAPTDDAFDLLGEETIAALLEDPDTLSDILLYHVVSGTEIDAATATAAAGTTVEMTNGDSVAVSLNGSDVVINLSTVTMADVEAANGIIHVIDAVLTPPAEADMPTMNIVETAVANGSFTTLAGALDVADLIDTLSNENEQFTVFAPTDAAFDLIDDAALAALLEDIPALTDVLLQHVIIGQTVDSITAFTLNGTSVDTAADNDVTIEIVDGVLEIQGSAVSTFDIYTSNGVIHVIDAVITETLQ